MTGKTPRLALLQANPGLQPNDIRGTSSTRKPNSRRKCQAATGT
jgi:hypothetical protein